MPAFSIGRGKITGRAARLLAPIAALLLLPLTLTAPVQVALSEEAGQVSLDQTSGPPRTSLNWIAPHSGEVVAGQVDLQVAASDSIGIDSPARFYVGDGKSSATGPWKEIEGETQFGGASKSFESLTSNKTWDTRGLGDSDRTLSAVIESVDGRETSLSESVAIDNTAPSVAITSPGPGQPEVIKDSVEIVASITDTHLSTWATYGEVSGQPPVLISKGSGEVSSTGIGTWSGRMAPGGYSGPVDLVVIATDSATPKPNVTTARRTIISDYYKKAFGTLGLGQSYDVSSTIPVTADITGDLRSWTLSITRGQSAPIFQSSGTSKGSPVKIATFNDRKYGLGTYLFSLVTIDSSGHEDHSDTPVTFRWTPAKLTLTYVGPPTPGPKPTDHPLAQFEDPAVSGTVEIRGEITGTNVMAWAIGRPIEAENPAFSPDGTRVVFASKRDDPWNTDIYVINADGTGLARLTYDPAFDYAPRFSPDGSEIVFSSNRDYSPTAPGTDLYLMNQDGTNIRRLTTSGLAEFPGFSADGEKITFDGSYGAANGIFVMNADGSDITNVAPSGNYPAFSPDRTKVIYSDFDTGEYTYKVRTVDITTPDHPITTLATGIQPSYSPDGTKVLYMDPYVISLMNADGTTPTEYGVSGNDPIFTPDGQSVVYSDSSGQIVMIPGDPAEGGDPQTVIESDDYHQSREPGTTSTETAFPPSKTLNSVVPIDVSAFEEGSYLNTPPYQFPTETMPPDSVLGHIDTNRLPPGVNDLSVMVIQCDDSSPPLPKFIYRPGQPEDEETSATVDALGNHCNAYSATVVLSVQVTRAHVDAQVTVSETAEGFSGPLSRPKVFTASGTWQPDDAWAFDVAPKLPYSYPTLPEAPIPDLARAGEKMWGKGPPVTDGTGYRPVGDLLGTQYMKLLINEPVAGMTELSGSAPPLLGSESFAPGRTGDRYEVKLPAGNFGGASSLSVWVDQANGLLGAIQFHQRSTMSGPSAAQPGGSWGSATGTTRSADVRLLFGGYDKDYQPIVPVVAEAGG